MSGSDNVFVRPARGVAGLVLAWLLTAASPAAAQPVPLGYMLLTGTYAALYIAVLLTGAIVIFSRRDFK